MRADAYFAIGKTHKVCQDYARGGVVPARRGHLARAYAVVSDGCSSSPDTDFGARFLAAAAVHGLDVFGDQFDEKWVIWQARECVRRAPFPPVQCLDATLLVARERVDGRAQVLAYGDGVVLARRRDGTVETWEIDHRGAPAYLSYLLDAERMQRYFAEGYGKWSVTHRVGAEVVVAVEEGEGLAGWGRVFDPADFDLVMVLTDGVLSFQRTDDLSPVPLVDLLAHLVDIRVPAGEFLVRSHRFFLTKTCPKRGWQHADDFGTAALLLEEPRVS